jgi:subtilisin family serine protease
MSFKNSGSNLTTGSYLVLLEENDSEEGIKTIKKATGVSQVIRSSDLEHGLVTANDLSSAKPIFFDRLGVAVAQLDPNQLESIERAVRDDSNPILLVEPERYVETVSNRPSAEWIKYLEGYRDATNHLIDRLIGESKIESLEGTAADISITWGLEKTRVMNSPYSGKGVKIAILDSGFDLSHPDFNGRQIVEQSFIQNEGMEDALKHGTHCTGTACGSKSPTIFPRYGIAYNSEIYVGKVINNANSSPGGAVIAGIEWALRNGCKVISMSLRFKVEPGQAYSQVFETLAQRSLREGCILIAAAGNDSSRENNIIAPVGQPANCPSIMAVAAVDRNLQIASFSNGSVNWDGGRIDIAAPGVGVFSSVPMPDRYNGSYNGTSMATPHVAGIAALYIEAAQARGESIDGYKLWTLLIQNALRLPIPTADVGNGLVQAPL